MDMTNKYSRTSLYLQEHSSSSSWVEHYRRLVLSEFWSSWYVKSNRTETTKRNITSILLIVIAVKLTELVNKQSNLKIHIVNSVIHYWNSLIRKMAYVEIQMEARNHCTTKKSICERCPTSTLKWRTKYWPINSLCICPSWSISSLKCLGLWKAIMMYTLYWYYQV